MQDIYQSLKNFYHLIQALAANILYGFPSRRLKVIGVTGTDGKTTTTHLIYHILNHAGKKVSMISTVYAKVGGKEYETGLHTTTPDPFLVQSMLKRAADEGTEYFVLETTSHAIDQNRVWGIRYEIGVITNVTHEHLDYHHTYAKYLHTKKRLLERSHIAIVNKDDDSYRAICENLHTAKVVSYGLETKADYTLDFRNMFPYLADFNAYNYLAAYVAALAAEVDGQTAVKAMRTFELPPGRLDMVFDGKFSVMVDFAHTPNAISMILSTVRRLHVKKGKRIIHVFGSAGLRDVSKRPLMGRESATYADLIILTEEDYRTEDPDDICREIARGIEEKGKTLVSHFSPRDSGKYTIIIDRNKAIAEALRIAKAGDIVVITGKGHEKSLCRGTVEYPWSDRDAVKTILKQ